MQIKAKTVDEYLEKIPKDRKQYIIRLRETIQSNIPEGFVEQMSYGMIGYVVPHSIYPDGYHCDPQLPLPFVNIASQKHFIGFYHMGIYADPKLYDWFVKEYPKHNKYKLDMGKSCVRFKKIDQIPYQLIGDLMQRMTVDDWIKLYEKNYKK
ncbi:MAG: DUF1801 domain-containing protein [Bacteroidetes bacterium]|jgi:hypothetical protein|nr:DUF1801 domain-containing protein [Bacteroidota bacterium]